MAKWASSTMQKRHNLFARIIKWCKQHYIQLNQTTALPYVMSCPALKLYTQNRVRSCRTSKKSRALGSPSAGAIQRIVSVAENGSKHSRDAGGANVEGTCQANPELAVQKFVGTPHNYADSLEDGCQNRRCAVLTRNHEVIVDW